MSRIGSVVDALNYDFSQFELNHFIDVARKYRKRDIYLVEVLDKPMPAGIDALWTPRQYTDFILYDPTRPKFVQLHGILHELGHILLDHKPLVKWYANGDILIESGTPIPENSGLPDVSYLVHDGLEEAEADAFAAEVQIRCNRSQRPVINSTDISSIPGIAISFDGMAFDE